MTQIVKHNGDTIALNKRAHFDFAIEETFEAGLVLTGTEVKSLRLGQARITQSHVTIEHGEAYIHGMYINEYAPAGMHLQHQPSRPRKLLLSRRQINKLAGATERAGMTIVAIALFFNKSGKAKLKIGLAKGKQKHDKRQAIKDRDWQRRKSKLLN